MAWNNFSNPYMASMPGQFNASPYMQAMNTQAPSQCPNLGLKCLLLSKAMV